MFEIQPEGQDLPSLLASRSSEIPVPLTVIPQIQVTHNCNLACTYCFQDHKGQPMTEETMSVLLDKVVATNLKHGVGPKKNVMPIYWHGGEPLLGGIEFFRKVIEVQSRHPGVVFDNRIQTNGTLMTEEFAEFFAENEFSVGFSLDGPQRFHDRSRVDRSGAGTFDAVMRGMELYRRIAKPPMVPVIWVVTRESVRCAPEIYDFFKALNAGVQLGIYDIRTRDMDPCAKENPEIFDLAPTAAEIGDFLVELFDLWFYDGDRQVDFHELRNEVKYVLLPELNLGDPFNIKRCDVTRTIFHPSGNVYSCDQYVNDERSSLGNIATEPIEEILRRKGKLWEEIKLHLRGSGDQMGCYSCDLVGQCVGGCTTCMKYNSLLLRARERGLPDSQWFEAELPTSLGSFEGETYYCDGLRALRAHVRRAVTAELPEEQLAELLARGGKAPVAIGSGG